MKYADRRAVQKATRDILNNMPKDKHILPENGVEKKTGISSSKAPSVKGANLVY